MQDPTPRGIDRRTFFMEGVTAATLLALAGCMDTMGPDPGRPIGRTIVVADYPELASVGGIALVSQNGTPLAVIRTSGTSFLALSRVCPHQGSVVGPTSNGFRCPRHGARFNEDGTWVGGQPTRNLSERTTSYDVSTDTLTIG